MSVRYTAPTACVREIASAGNRELRKRLIARIHRSASDDTIHGFGKPAHMWRLHARIVIPGNAVQCQTGTDQIPPPERTIGVTRPDQAGRPADAKQMQWQFLGIDRIIDKRLDVPMQ